MKAFRVLVLVIFVFLASSCNYPGFDSSGQTTELAVEENTASKVEAAEVVFQVVVPPETPSEDAVFLHVMDEVTGLNLNPITYQLTSVGTSLYEAHIPVPIGSVVKYRYTHGDSLGNIEFTPMGKQVRYRLAYVEQPMIVTDTISSWGGTGYTGNYGRIEGVIQTEDGKPVADMLVVAAGVQSISTADGHYLLDGVPIGKHNLVAYSMDGKYSVFQQEAMVASDTMTPADLLVAEPETVSVTFNVDVPADGTQSLPVRMIGNLYSLGNTFADLQGGVSTIASRSPIMDYRGENHFSLTLELPVGYDLRYKYSRGDGFWSAEQNESDRFPVRQFIVPDVDTVIEDTVESWNSSQKAPVSFYVQEAPGTPDSAKVSIQFKTFDWGAPIPMWQVDDTHWVYILFGPMDLLGSMHYRYCLNDECELSPEVNDDGLLIQRSLTIQDQPQNLNDLISGWRWEQSSSNVHQVEIAGTPYDRSAFITGFEVEEAYQPGWQSYLREGIREFGSISSDWVVFAPEWEFTRVNLPAMEPITGGTMLSKDLEQASKWTHDEAMELVLYPQSTLGRFQRVFWDTAQLDYGWWRSWFDRYQRFILHYAGIADTIGADAIILGEPGMVMALEGGMMPNGEASNIHPDFYHFWSDLVGLIRERYDGQIYWALRYDGDGTPTLPVAADAVDGIYIMWSKPLTQSSSASEAELYEQFSIGFDQDLSPLSALDKPIVIGLEFASADGVGLGCLMTSDVCLENRYIVDYSAYAIDLDEQATIYSAALRAVDEREWVDGVISRGVYPNVSVMDPSPSARGKTAYAILQAWFRYWNQTD